MATFLVAWQKPPYILLEKKALVNTANFSWFIGDHINGVPLYIAVLLNLNIIMFYRKVNPSLCHRWI